MRVFVFGVRTEAGKRGGEGSACSSPLSLPARDEKCRRNPDGK